MVGSVTLLMVSEPMGVLVTEADVIGSVPFLEDDVFTHHASSH